MQAVKGKITTHGINAFKKMGIELEETSRELGMGQPVKIDLWGSHDEYTNEYPRNKDTHDSFPDKSSDPSIPQGIIYRRPRDNKKERHHPVSEELYVNG